MKKIYVVLLFAIIASSLYAQTGRNNTYRIGDTGPAGGIIFYDKKDNSEGWRYLEAAPVEAEFSEKVWCSLSAIVANMDGVKTNPTVEGTQESIGSGKRNTELIVERLNEFLEWDTAAQQADALVFNGYNDWFLPSKEELNQMYRQLKRKRLGDFKNDRYWSSTQLYDTAAYCLDFTNGSIGFKGQDEQLYFRPIRQVAGQ